MSSQSYEELLTKIKALEVEVGTLKAESADSRKLILANTNGLTALLYSTAFKFVSQQFEEKEKDEKEKEELKSKLQGTLFH